MIHRLDLLSFAVFFARKTADLYFFTIVITLRYNLHSTILSTLLFEIVGMKNYAITNYSASVGIIQVIITSS